MYYYEPKNLFILLTKFPEIIIKNYFNLSKENLYDDYHMGMEVVNTIENQYKKGNQNDLYLFQLIEQLYSYDVSIILTQTKTLKSKVVIDLCFEKKQSKNRKNKNFFLRLYYHKSKNIIEVFNEKSLSINSYRNSHKLNHKKHLFYCNPELLFPFSIKDLIQDNILSFKDILKQEYKNTIIHSENTFFYGSKSPYIQEHFKVDNKEHIIYINNFLFNIIKSNLLNIVDTNNLTGDFWFSGKQGINHYNYWNVPIFELNYLIIPSKENSKVSNLTLDKSKSNENVLSSTISNKDIQEGFLNIPEIGKIHKKRNQYDKYIKDNGLIRGIEWL